MADAGRLRETGARAPVLFLDEIHRFNKAQQDALLPSVERGDVVLIGATTENPSFEVNAALLSRCRLLVLEALSPDHLVTVLERALDSSRGLASTGVIAHEDALKFIAERSGGDARFALGALELACTAALRENATIDTAVAEGVLATTHLVYDKAGEEHFNLISALHKSLRNSDAQAGIYYLARMLESGEDPLYVARRLVRFASEDVGLADPQALVQANAAADAVHRLGMPEGALALAQAAVYLAQAPKSNALYAAWKGATAAIRDGARHPVPLRLRNAPTRVMKDLGYGDGYDYAHDHEQGVAPMRCLPDEIADRVFYRPTDRGFEVEAGDRLREAWRRSQPADET
jgi:putative ATPase